MTTMGEPTTCTFIPPYLLEALAASGDPHLEGHARATLDLDEDVRRRRPGGGILGLSGASPSRASARGAAAAGPAPSRTIYDAQHGSDLPGLKVRGEGDPASADPRINEAYDGLGDTWTLLETAYGRNSLDGKGMGLLASVHYGTDYDNAFWDGSQMVFGDGDGTIFLPFTRSIDVIGHELAHGMTQYTAGLAYQGQSGALNESVSDVVGVLVKQRTLGQSADEADWLIGAELLAPGVKGVAIRSMKAPGTAYDDPRLGTDPQPAHMRDYVDTTADNGGVHINSGIPNHAFYLLATALGGRAWERAGQIWYDTLTGEISADCDFATFARLTHAAALARYGDGSVEAEAVARAWTEVGVEPAAGTAGPAGTGAAGSAGTGTGAPAPADAEIRIRRTGGFTGLVRERTVVLADLPAADTRHWQHLLGGDELRAIAAGRTHPDAFSYAVRCGHPALDVELPEPAIPEDVRALIERTLEA